jgi:hypothetical protein
LRRDELTRYLLADLLFDEDPGRRWQRPACREGLFDGAASEVFRDTASPAFSTIEGDDAVRLRYCPLSRLSVIV